LFYTILTGIVFDTRACVGRCFLWVVAFPSLIAGYRFRYPCLWGVSVRVVRSSCVVGIVFDTYEGAGLLVIGFFN